MFLIQQNILPDLVQAVFVGERERFIRAGWKSFRR